MSDFYQINTKMYKAYFLCSLLLKIVVTIKFKILFFLSQSVFFFNNVAFKINSSVSHIYGVQPQVIHTV